LIETPPSFDLGSVFFVAPLAAAAPLGLAGPVDAERERFLPLGSGAASADGDGEA
jgi:hypothetical protein